MNIRISNFEVLNNSNTITISNHTARYISDQTIKTNKTNKDYVLHYSNSNKADSRNATIKCKVYVIKRAILSSNALNQKAILQKYV